MQQRRALEAREKDFISRANEPGTQRNYDSRISWYLEFCEFGKMKPFPVNEFKISKFATFLADSLKTVESIKMYCSSVCQENELRGFRPAKRGIRFYKTITGIRKELRHQVKRAEPLTVELLEKIHKVVQLQNDNELVVWVTLCTGFHLILRKSYLVPLSRMHDMVHNISRSDVRYSKGVMMIFIRWSKTNQFMESINRNPMVGNNHSVICPVRWILHMIERILAEPHHNLFSFKHEKTGLIVPITYRDLMMTMRKWLDLVGVVNTKRFSSHSIHRGPTTHAFNARISDNMIMKMGGWTSDCYRRYIDIGLKARIKAWKKFSN